MAAISFDPRINNNKSHHHHHQHGPIIEEIEGLIRVYKDGCVERPPIIPTVPCTTSDPSNVTSRDIKLANETWARVYVPVLPKQPMPLLVYFHGGGFCVGSAAWKCYHEFLERLAAKAGCVIVSVNYRLAPENRLPAAYEDGINVFLWIKQQALGNPFEHKWWLSRCNLWSLFLAGDSAGANIAYHLATRLERNNGMSTNPLSIKGVILIQPFFGGESRTSSEKQYSISSNSALTLSASDAYWRLALPPGANRDHPWCNPLVRTEGFRESRFPAILVCVSEMDILKDRSLEFCKVLRNAGKEVEAIMYKGVGHAFHILYNSPMANARVQEMICHLKGFINQ